MQATVRFLGPEWPSVRSSEGRSGSVPQAAVRDWRPSEFKAPHVGSAADTDDQVSSLPTASSVAAVSGASSPRLLR
jgi:hypothetical protein